MAHQQLRLPGETVKMSNELARLPFKNSSVYCGRIIAAFASMIKDSDTDFQEYSIPARSILKTGVSHKGGKTFKEISDAANMVLQTIVEMPKADADSETFERFTMIASMAYKNGVLTGSIHPKLKPFYLGLKERFTLFPLQEYLGLPTTYAQGLYEFLVSWSDKESIQVSLDKLNDILDTPESYRSRYPDFRRWILEPATKAILKNTTLRFEWEPVKGGRRIVAINFRFISRPYPKQKKLPDPNSEHRKQITAPSNNKEGKTKSAPQPKISSDEAKNNSLIIKAMACRVANIERCKQDKGEQCELCIKTGIYEQSRNKRKVKKTLKN